MTISHVKEVAHLRSVWYKRGKHSSSLIPVNPLVAKRAWLISMMGEPEPLLCQLSACELERLHSAV